MFEGFSTFDLPTSDPQCKIRGVIGGSGPPLLLIHGNPLTHVHWHLVAPRLAEKFTVVATDLRGYGDSSKPRGLPDHSNYTFRRITRRTLPAVSRCRAGTIRPSRRRKRPGASSTAFSVNNAKISGYG
jgi:pimeloyl-ACP methyl ester carboxylesterase